MSLEWILAPEDGIEPFVDAYIGRLYNAVWQLLISYEPRIEAWLKQNAPWIDQTGNARQGLYAQAVQEGNMLAIIMDYSVFYGWFLEMSNSGRYAIITPAVDVFAQQIFDDIKALLQ